MDLEKYVHPDINKNLSKSQKFFWYVVIFFPFMTFIICAGFALLIFFANDDNKSISVSNIGFGILMALASVCFSYYKVLNPNDYVRLHLDVQKSGELFLVSAIAFIVSSALKYSWTVIQPGSFLSNFGGREAIQVSFKITFFVAESICVLGLGRLIDVLHIRFTLPKN